MLVITGVDPGSSQFNKSSNPYFILASRFAARPGMTHDGGTFVYQKSGFTLIELLVVVLIIGILSAVALPQYENAVLKSRAAGLLSNLKTLRQAAEVYYLANGKYPVSFSELDVSLAGEERGDPVEANSSLLYLSDGSSYALDQDGYIGAGWDKYGLTFNYWYTPIWGVKEGCFLMRAPTEKLKKLGRSMGRFTQTTVYGDIFEIC